MNNTASKGKTQPLSEKIYGKLLDRIISGKWQPGSLFDRRSVAAEMGVSVAPVSEAMLRLEQDGFLLTIPRKGTMLRACDPRRLYENLILREAIETQAVRMAFKKLQNPPDKLIRLAKEADSGKNPERSITDEEFHFELVRLAGVEILAAELKRLKLQLMFDELILIRNSDALGDPHEKLIKDLKKAASPDKAAERIIQHLRVGREPIFQRFESENI